MCLIQLIHNLLATLGTGLPICLSFPCCFDLFGLFDLCIGLPFGLAASAYPCCTITATGAICVVAGGRWGRVQGFRCQVLHQLLTEVLQVPVRGSVVQLGKHQACVVGGSLLKFGQVRDLCG